MVETLELDGRVDYRKLANGMSKNTLTGNNSAVKETQGPIVITSQQKKDRLETMKTIYYTKPRALWN